MTHSGTSAVLVLAVRYLGNRRLATCVSIAAIALSLLLVVALALTNFAVKKAAVQGSVRYPLIVGAANASSVQLVLSTVFHVDKPVGTVDYEVYEQLASDHRVIAAYPMAVADSLQAYPIIGTDEAFLRDLAVAPTAGAIDLSQPHFVVVGAEVAERLELRVGDTFRGTHGMVGGEDATEHAALRYRVSAILGATGGPEDAAIYCALQSVWLVHHAPAAPAARASATATSQPGSTRDEAGRHAEADKYHLARGRLTAVLVRTANPVYTAQLERELTLRAGTQAVDTGRAVRRLLSYLNQGERFVEAFSAVTLAVALALILVTLVMSLSERRKELALLRVLGIGQRTIAAVIMVEALIITGVGVSSGLLLGHVAVWWSEHLIHQGLGVAVEPWTITGLEAKAALMAVAAGQALALVAAAWTYRLNLAEEVSRD